MKKQILASLTCVAVLATAASTSVSADEMMFVKEPALMVATEGTDPVDPSVPAVPNAPAPADPVPQLPPTTQAPAPADPAPQTPPTTQPSDPGTSTPAPADPSAPSTPPTTQEPPKTTNPGVTTPKVTKPAPVAPAPKVKPLTTPIEVNGVNVVGSNGNNIVAQGADGNYYTVEPTEVGASQDTKGTWFVIDKNGKKKELPKTGTEETVGRLLTLSGIILLLSTLMWWRKRA